MTAKKITGKLGVTRQYLSLLRKTHLKKGRDFTQVKLGERTYYDYTAEGLKLLKSIIKKFN